MKKVRISKLNEDDELEITTQTCLNKIRGRGVEEWAEDKWGDGEPRKVLVVCGAPMKFHRKSGVVCSRGGKNCGLYTKKQGRAQRRASRARNRRF